MSVTNFPRVYNLSKALLDLVMTSGFSTIAGSVLSAYINLGVPAQNLITSSVMSIPASMAISKIRIPEMEEPVTRGRLSIDRGEKDSNEPVSIFCYLLCFKCSWGWYFVGKRPSCIQSRCNLRSCRRWSNFVCYYCLPNSWSPVDLRFSGQTYSLCWLWSQCEFSFHMVLESVKILMAFFQD